MESARTNPTPALAAPNSDTWTLNAEQMLFMLQHHNDMLAAFSHEDSAWVEAFMARQEYRLLFGTMGFDEAFDRYETMLDQGRNGDSSVVVDL